MKLLITILALLSMVGCSQKTRLITDSMMIDNDASGSKIFVYDDKDGKDGIEDTTIILIKVKDGEPGLENIFIQSMGEIRKILDK